VDPVALTQPSRGLERLRGLEREQARLILQGLDPEPVAGVRTLDRQLAAAGQLAGRASVIDVRVGEQDLLQLELVRGYDLQHRVQVTARIDDCRRAGTVTPDHRAILLEWGDWNDLELHRVSAHHAGGHYGATERFRVRCSDAGDLLSC